jgi:hypothetical protein
MSFEVSRVLREWDNAMKATVNQSVRGNTRVSDGVGGTMKLRRECRIYRVVGIWFPRQHFNFLEKMNIYNQSFSSDSKGPVSSLSSTLTFPGLLTSLCRLKYPIYSPISLDFLP